MGKGSKGFGPQFIESGQAHHDVAEGTHSAFPGPLMYISDACHGPSGVIGARALCRKRTHYFL